MKLSSAQREKLIDILKKRFEKNMNRHRDIEWIKIKTKLDLPSGDAKLLSLYEMEKSGGEPDVVVFDKNTAEYFYCDCSAESPKGRRSLCYDREALESRKKFKPKNSALDMAAEIGVELLNEQQYRALQKLDQFDLKTSSWVSTPPEIRKLGGAIFCDLRYDKVFTYHNGAESYYAARGFRGLLKL